jgi:hypothetical protein
MSFVSPNFSGGRMSEPINSIRAGGEDAPPQNALQAAVAKGSATLQVSDAVVKACAGEYLPVSALFGKPEVRALVRDANHLSIVLSDGYLQGKLGRINYHVGTTRYAYGAPDPSKAMMSQKATRTTKSPRKAISKPVSVMNREASEKITAHQPYTLTLEFDDAEAALAFMMKNGLVSKIVKA